jgi:hypothetical protein
MKKTILVLLLIIVLIIGSLSRLSILGWLTILAFLTVFIFGFIHTLINYILIRHAEELKNKGLLLIGLYHLLFLGLFFFQSDFDDSRGYVVIKYLWGIDSKSGEEQSTWTFFFICLIFYFLFTVILLFKLKTINPEFKTKKIKNIIFLIAGVIIIPIGILFFNSYIKDRDKEIESEKEGKYENLRRALRNKNNARYLRLYQYPNSYTEIPKDVFRLTELETLELYSNAIKEIHKEVSSLKKIKSLNLQYNQIKSIPDEISGLTNLEELVLMNNFIDSINPKICDCLQLKSFSVSGVSLKHIPDCLSKMPALEKLVVQSDSINNFMYEFRQFKNLKELDLFTYKNEIRDNRKYNELKKTLPNTKMYIPSSSTIPQ